MAEEETKQVELETMTPSLRKDLDTAIFLVEVCAKLARDVQLSQDLSRTNKIADDPVTKADLAIQSLVTLYLGGMHPSLNFLAEEDAEQVQNSETLLTSVTSLVNQYFPFSSLSSPRDPFSPQEIIESLTKGGANADDGEVWLMDPIDGTRGFVLNGQYAVCLGKIIEGTLTVSCVACPNVPAGDYKKQCTYDEKEGFWAAPKINPDQTDCWLLAAVRGYGTRQTRFTLTDPGNFRFEDMTPCEVSAKTSTFDFDYAESRNYPPETQQKAARVCSGMEKPMYRLDSMTKYCLVASGHLEAYLRFSGVQKQKLWDHIAELLVLEAGGEVSDILGISLNFTTGRYLSKNVELVASNKKCHEDICEVARTVCRRKQR